MWHWTASDTTTTDDKNNKDSLTEVQYRRSSLVHNVHLHGCQMLTLRHGYLPQTELYTISTVSVISILWVPGTQTLGAEPHPKHDFKHETDSVHCVFWDKTVNVCLQWVSETAAITCWRHQQMVGSMCRQMSDCFLNITARQLNTNMTLVHWSSEPANNAVTTDMYITAVTSDETGTSSLLSVYLHRSQQLQSTYCTVPKYNL